ncbi:MAG: homocysteine S-methyltransferase family protein [Pseudomonadota bacterium]
MNDRLPQLEDRLFLTDGGLETTLVFHEKIDLPDFAAFVLLETEEGEETLRAYYRRYLKIADAARCGFILEAPTWRASRDWGVRRGYGQEALHEINCKAIALLKEIRDDAARPEDVVVSGQIGPRGDGYVVSSRMSADEAQSYHKDQLSSFRTAGADVACAMTLGYPEEAIGIARAARDVSLPVAIGFTTETDGTLPCGDALASAVAAVDAATEAYPAYFILNCAHPDHFRGVLDPEAPWIDRVRGLRANASRMSHEELDEAEDLDAGDPVEFGALHAKIATDLPHITIFGGCCGTDHRHVAHAAKSVLERPF